MRGNMSSNAYSLGICTLGCKVSQYESEAIAEEFIRRGFVLRDFSDECDVYIINTCTVTAESDRKCRQMIRRAASTSSRSIVMVTGCYSQTNPGDIEEIPGVAYIGGSYNKTTLPDRALSLLSSSSHRHPVIEVSDLDNAPFEKMSVNSSPRTRAYVKIEDGCESRCTYCIIPKARGRIRSKPLADVVAEVGGLAGRGCREVVLTGIETASYGRDNGESLLSLLTALDGTEGLLRIRLGSLDPSVMTESFINSISKLRLLAPHFHLSLQSGSDRVLRMMKRGYSTDMVRRSVLAIRAAVPDASFTTDIIVGFPGETDADFDATVSLCREICFLNMHVFPYSRREGTPAAEMPCQVADNIKKDRVSALIAIRDKLTAKAAEPFIRSGKPMPVIFETDRPGCCVGHTPNFIEVAVDTPVPLHGKTADVRLLSCSAGICRGVLV